MKRLSTALLTVVMVVSLLSGCGGGGGGGSTPADTTGNAGTGSYTISGKVAEASGVGMAGVSMALTGSGSATATTDSTGNYSITGLANGTYTLTPTKAGYTCSPESKTINVNNADVTGQDFVGTDAAGNGADTTAPSVPTGLVATVISSSQINLTWAASTDSVGVAGYEVWRGSTKITTVTTMSYNDTGLAASTPYTYSVKSFDAAGNISASSTTATATTLAVGAGGGVAGQNWSIKVSNRMNLASNCQWSSTPPPVWSGTNTMQRGYGITWSGTKFVAVGDAGSILTSTDGVSWTMHSVAFVGFR